MMTTHQKLFEETHQAIVAIFNDLTVSHEQTLESLELLRDTIDSRIGAVRKDIEKK